MRIAIYGLPSSGKTTLINGIKNATTFSGSMELDRISSGKFHTMSEEDKYRIRVLYTEFLSELNDDVIVSDGHYSFLDNVVFTPDDGDIYDVFFYLFCKPEELLRRYTYSDKNEKYSSLSVETIRQWQEFEIESLRIECHKRNKDFYVVSDNNQTTSFYDFLELVVNGYSTVSEARKITEHICELYAIEKSNELFISDGDKTIIEQDSYRFCFNGKTQVFDGDFYSGYQSFLYKNEILGIKTVPDKVRDISLNIDVWNLIKEKPYLILSSGITPVWNSLKDIFGFAEVIADPMISADTKYYIVKFLKELGYSVTAFGDSKNDIYMLREATCGYLKIGKRISASLSDVNLDGISLIYNKEPYFLSDGATEEVLGDISICKSNSGIHGSALAAAHIRLGQRMGIILSSMYPSKNTAVLVLDRGGRFFGDGLYSTFGGVFYPYSPAKESLPEINLNRVVIVDSVINSGKSIVEIISKIKENKPHCEIVIVTNVIQRSAIELLSAYKLFAVRSSVNSFIGKRQATQTGNSGPDTADRLFNIISRSF